VRIVWVAGGVQFLQSNQHTHGPDTLNEKEAGSDVAPICHSPGVLGHVHVTLD